MKTPASYSEWSNCVEELEGGLNDEAVIQSMANGSLSWTSGVADLFSERISCAFNTRLRRCADRMARDLSQGADETILVRSLLDVRRTLFFLRRVGELPAFPQTLRDHLCSEIKRYAERAQRSLEDSAKHDRSGRLISLIRHNSLLAYEESSNTHDPAKSAPLMPDVSEARDSIPPRRRKILI